MFPRLFIRDYLIHSPWRDGSTETATTAPSRKAYRRLTMADNDNNYSGEDFQLWLSCFRAAFAAINLKVSGELHRARIAALCAQLADEELKQTQFRRANPRFIGSE